MPKFSQFVYLVLFTGFSFLTLRCSEEKTQRALLFSARNEVAMAAMNAIRDAAAQRHIEVDTTTDVQYLSEDSLQRYGAVVFIHLPPDALDTKHQNDVERFFQAGGGMVSIHTSACTPYQWPWFNELVGLQHSPAAAEKKASTLTLITENTSHRSTDGLPGKWTQHDALLTLPVLPEGTNVLVHTHDHKPVSWSREADHGRLFFTTAGGTAESYEKKAFLDHILGGIQYALEGNPLNYTYAKTARLPEENRFLQLVLDTYLDEPIEMEVMKDGKVLFIERHGNVKLYDPAKKATRIVGKLQVQLEGNYEDGLLGLELDPNFETNNFIYLYYSPLGGKPVQHLSRFKLQGDSLLMRSEKVVLEVPVQRETCCHSAGNVYFGPDGYLYLSTGDNTSSKESDGYTPIDERPGRGPFDAQKSSGNTHDLRGKILRIDVQEDGSYTIPDGNLFPKDGSHGRPEIYVMGARNPYRITVDKRGFVYWGDVGPDGGESSARGPMSHDEWNQARKPGNFGWPYFVANNKAYADFDFATNTIGPRFDPAHPVNESPYNYGAKTLPPAQPAIIWYPYNHSNEFPMLGTGSRSAMAGPFYYYSDYANSTVRLPEYYDGKLFIFEWARNWVKAVTFTEEGDLEKIEPFLPGFDFWHPIDIKFGSDGAMYVLQYGSNYFARNPDAQLVRIEYAEGNRQPVAQITADKTIGATPLTVQLSGAASFDYDGNTSLTYAWQSGHGVTSTEAQPRFTYDTAGVYKASLTVTDEAGSSATTTLEIKAGNETPQVTIAIDGNSSFYFDRGTLHYKVNVEDAEDGALGHGIDPSQVHFTIDYIREGKDLALLSSLGTSRVSAKYAKGKSLIDGSDCKSCHALDKKSIGPSYLDVANRYKKHPAVVSALVQKIIKGGNGNWGHAMMAAHPQLSEQDTRMMVEYILSLTEERKSLPLKGSFKMTEHIGKGHAGSYIITSSYTDKGHEITGPLTGRQMLVLRHPKVQAEDFDSFYNVGQQRPVNGDIAYVSDIKDGSYIAFKNIDLDGIGRLTFNIRANSGRIEIRAGSPEGKLLGTAYASGTAPDWRTVSTAVKDPGERTELFLVFKNDEAKNRNFMGLDWIEFNRK